LNGNPCATTSSTQLGYSIFDSGNYRKQSAEWLSSQQKATLHATSEVNM
jgi:hypothetical protein